MAHPVETGVADQALDVAAMLQADRQTQHAVAAIAATIQPGMREAEALARAGQILSEQGATQLWHPSMIRFGANTLKTFREPSEPDTVLAEHDILFIDLGPVWHGHEGDGADTFVVGHDGEMAACAEAARTIFTATRKYWLTGQPGGQELYRYANRLADQMGWVLNANVAGHRVGAFPNQSRALGPLAGYRDYPPPGEWILEVQIRHPGRPFGAFYEGLLG